MKKYGRPSRGGLRPSEVARGWGTHVGGGHSREVHSRPPLPLVDEPRGCGAGSAGARPAASCLQEAPEERRVLAAAHRGPQARPLSRALESPCPSIPRTGNGGEARPCCCFEDIRGAGPESRASDSTSHAERAASDSQTAALLGRCHRRPPDVETEAQRDRQLGCGPTVTMRDPAPPGAAGGPASRSRRWPPGSRSSGRRLA